MKKKIVFQRNILIRARNKWPSIGIFTLFATAIFELDDVSRHYNIERLFKECKKLQNWFKKKRIRNLDRLGFWKRIKSHEDYSTVSQFIIFHTLPKNQH